MKHSAHDGRRDHRVGYKLGAWHDVMWLARTLAPYDTSPPKPLSLPELRDEAILSAALASGLSLL